MAAGTLYTYPENFRGYKAVAAANYSGFNLTVDAGFKYGTTNQTPEFLAKFPLGKVPALETSDGLCLNESNAIAVYVANDQLVGATKAEKAQVTQWMNFADQEIMPAVCTWVFPCMGFMQYNKANTERAKEEVRAAMEVLDKALSGKQFLVGGHVTLADLSVATTLLLAYQWVMEPAFRSSFGSVNKWFENLMSQPQVKKAVPDGFKMCEKMAQFDAKKYAQVAGADKKKAGGNEKKEKKAQQPKKETPKKAEEKAAQPAAQAAAAAPATEVKKSKSPFEAFPNSETFILDEWKKIYSNEDVDTVTMPYFWEKFDAEKYSIWYGKYKYDDDLSSMDFVNANLIGGTLQRLDGLRKYGFGLHAYFNKPKKTIRAVYIARGPHLPFSLTEDLNVDAPSYDWEQLDFHNEAHRKIITEYWSCEGEFDGYELYDIKDFK